MTSIWNGVIYGAVALAVLFLLLPTVILPYFSTAYSFCQHQKWYGANTTLGVANLANCTNVITSYNTSKITPGVDYLNNPVSLDSYNNDNFCLNCDTAGGFRAPSQGIMILILFMALISAAIYFIPKIRK